MKKKKIVKKIRKLMSVGVNNADDVILNGIQSKKYKTGYKDGVEYMLNELLKMWKDVYEEE